MRVSVKSNDASLTLPISVFRISSTCFLVQVNIGQCSSPLSWTAYPTRKEVGISNVLAKFNPRQQMAGSRPNKHSHPKQWQSLPMTQACYHPRRFRNEFRDYYSSNTVYSIRAIQQQITVDYGNISASTAGAFSF